MNVFQKFGHDVRNFFEPKNLKRRLKAKGKIFPIVTYTLLALWVVIFLAMLIWVFFTSLKTDYDFIYYPLSLPKQEWLCQFVDAASAILYPCLLHRYHLLFCMGSKGMDPKQKGEKDVKKSFSFLICHRRKKLFQASI